MMNSNAYNFEPGAPTHPWLCKLDVAYVPGPGASSLESMVEDLLQRFRRLGHRVQKTPNDETDVLFTPAPFNEPLDWREALLFTARRRFDLNSSPTIYTLVHVPKETFQRTLSHFDRVLEKEPPEPADYDFPGMAPQAYRVLFEQGRRGGPILALERLVQSQAKCIDVLLVVGDDQPEATYLFNLVGAHPRIAAYNPDSCEEIARRIVTAESTSEVTDHKVVGDPIPHELWERLSTPQAMRTAARELGKRDFFTNMVRIADLVNVPAVAASVSSQYSEGCFSTWDPELDALIATVTGSARPVKKDSITEDDLAAIVGVRPDGEGALLHHVEGKPNDPPSSEALEMIDMDNALPPIRLGEEWESSAEVPVVRSKLHGHRSIAAYDPERVEYAPIAQPYQHYPVTCATGAQARGIKEAFAHAESLQNPEDPRQVVFTVLPGHGTVIVEKWVPGTAPFQTILEYMDADYLTVESRVPQGPIAYKPAAGRGNVVKCQSAERS